LEFDEGQVRGVGVPDGYKRWRKIIFLVESKATIFPDDLWEQPNFDKLRAYLEERFVQSKGNPKGVSQLANNVTTILTGGFPFDPIASDELAELEIYPTLIHNDYQFSMPGINQFLQEHFERLIPSNVPDGVTIRPVTLINLDWLFDLSFRKGTFETLKDLIDRYYENIRRRNAVLASASREQMQEKFVASRESFDLVYQYQFVRDLPAMTEGEDLHLEELFSFAGLTQEILETEV
jgi:hypothetical protein